MADNKDIFGEDWLECLRAHYMHVVRASDKVTLPSLTVVMEQAGFNQSELAELRVRATMHVDTTGADFVPDLDVYWSRSRFRFKARKSNKAPAVIEQPPQVVEPASVIDLPETPEELLIDESPLDDELEPEPEAVIEEVPEDDPDAPEQLSLF